MRRLVAPLLALTLAAWLALPLPLRAQEADLVELARAYIGARNAHDLDAVLECFAPDAVVRRRDSSVPGEVWDTRDKRVVEDFLFEEGWRVSFSWVRGAGEIRTLMSGAFRWKPRLEAFNYRSSGTTVTWDYREYLAEPPGMTGIGPVEGVAVAEVQAGRIVRLTEVDDPASVARQRAAVNALARQKAARATPPVGWRRPAEGVPVGTAAAAGPGPDDPIVPQALVGLGAGAFALARLMRRRRACETRPAAGPAGAERDSGPAVADG